MGPKFPKFPKKRTWAQCQPGATEETTEEATEATEETLVIEGAEVTEAPTTAMETLPEGGDDPAGTTTQPTASNSDGASSPSQTPVLSQPGPKRRRTRRKKTEPEPDYSQLMREHVMKNRQTGQACDRCKMKRITCDSIPSGCRNCTTAAVPCRMTDRVTAQTFTRGLPSQDEMQAEIIQLKGEIMRLRSQLEGQGSPPSQAQQLVGQSQATSLASASTPVSVSASAGTPSPALTPNLAPTTKATREANPNRPRTTFEIEMERLRNENERLLNQIQQHERYMQENSVEQSLEDLRRYRATFGILPPPVSQAPMQAPTITAPPATQDPSFVTSDPSLSIFGQTQPYPQWQTTADLDLNRILGITNPNTTMSTGPNINDPMRMSFGSDTATSQVGQLGGGSFDYNSLAFNDPAPYISQNTYIPGPNDIGGPASTQGYMMPTQSYLPPGFVGQSNNTRDPFEEFINFDNDIDGLNNLNTFGNPLPEAEGSGYVNPSDLMPQPFSPPPPLPDEEGQNQNY